MKNFDCSSLNTHEINNVKFCFHPDITSVKLQPIKCILKNLADFGRNIWYNNFIKVTA